MPRNILGDTPFDLCLIDTDTPISLSDVENTLGEAQGKSLCVRSVEGPPKRGGYFFHIERSGTNFIIRDFAKHTIDTLEAEKLVRFINHVSGRQFDPDILAYCQSIINFREDQIAGAEET